MKWKNKGWITIWLILVCVALVVTGTYAAYTNVEYVKRVVSTQKGNQQAYFTSNYLQQRTWGTSTFPLRMIPIGKQSDVSVTVSVCNYLQNDISKISQEKIAYSFEAQLVDLNNNPVTSAMQVTYHTENGVETVDGDVLASKIKINDIAFDANGTCSFDGELPGGVASQDYYSITCDAADIPMLSAVAIQIKAVPNESGIGVQLMGQLRISSNIQQNSTWTGSFTGLGSDESDTTTLDAFNYSMSGTVQQSLRLKWNADRVTLGKWSRELFGENVTVVTIPAEKDENGNVITPKYEYIDIEVGGVGMPTDYTLQFYRVNGIPENEKAKDVKDYVSLREYPSTQNSGT